MADSVKNSNEVILNSIRYKLGGDGQVHPILTSQFAPKQVVGDYTKDSDPSRSVWSVMSDQSGGIGVENFVKESQVNRSFWQSCNVDYPNSSFLPPLATPIALDSYPGYLLNSGFETWTVTNVPDSWTEVDSLNYLTITQDQTDEDSGSSDMLIDALTSTIGSSTECVKQSFTTANSLWNNNYRSKSITFKARCKRLNAGAASAGIVAFLSIYDGIGTTNGSAVQVTNAGYSDITVTRTLNAGATELTLMIQVTNTSGGSISFHWDTAYLKAPYTGAILKKAVEFNSEKYIASGYNLWKLNATGNGYTLVDFYTTTITDIEPSVNSCLYVFLGDSISYQYVNTAGTSTEAVGSDGAGGSTSSAATFGIHWDNKLFKITSAGQLAYSTTPNSATPTWTANGLLDTTSRGTINGLITYNDATGANVIYAGTTKGLSVHDYANAWWENTALTLPLHADNGKGMVVQNGCLYYSAGSSVYEYRLVNGDLSIRSMGLDMDDGLPDVYVGSINNLIGGFSGDFYALVNANLISSSNYSSVIKYSNGSWRPVWVDGTVNESISCGIVSSVYDYRLWFNTGTGMNWIPLNRSRRNPLKVSTTTYGASALYLSPWFDGLWTAGNKLALATRALALGTSATETVTIKYRIDKTNTDLGTGWTTQDILVLADAGVESVVKFGSSAGLSFKTIQFRVDYARGSTTTLTPNLVYLTLEYEKVIPPKWGWKFVVDCTENYNDKSPSVLLDALVTAAETATLVTFYYKDVAKYVRVISVEGERLTGDNSRGQYTVAVVEK